MSEVVCSVCASHRKTLHPRKSKLLSTVTLYLCSDCVKASREPRYLIILVGRTKGPESVVEYIKYHRYVGEAILAKELISSL